MEIKSLIKNLRERDRLVINNEGYKIIRIDDNWWFNEKKDKVENRGKVFYLYKIGDKPMPVLPLFHTLNYYKNENKLKFFKSKIRENLKFPKDIPERFKHKIEETNEVLIKNMQIKQK